MIVSDANKFIFIHIPKCAGNTTRNWLRAYDTRGEFFWGAYQSYHKPGCIVDLAHITLPVLKTMLGEEVFNSYYKFAVIRNPYDRAYSAFVEASKYFPDYRTHDGFKRFLTQNLTSITFDQFIKGGNTTVHFTPQHMYVYEDGEKIVDHVCRLDDIDQELRRIACQLGLDYPEELENLAVRGNIETGSYRYMSKYNKKLIQIINQVYEKDFECFGFEMLDKPLKE